MRGLGRETLWYGLSMLAAGVLQLAQIYLFTRLLPPDEFGVYFMILSLNVLINSLSFSWINQTIKRYLSGLAGAARAQFLGRVVALYLLVLALLLLLSAAAALLLPRFGLSPLLAWATLALSLGSGAATCIQWFYTVRRQAADFAINQLVQNIARLGLGWLLLTQVARSGDMLVWSMCLAGLLAALVGVARLREPVSFGRHSFDPEPLRAMLAYGWPLGQVNAGSWLLNISGRVMLAPLAGLSAAGIYSAAHQLSQQMLLLALQPVVTAADPLAIRVYERDGRAAAARFLSILFGFLVLLGSGVCLGMALLAGPLAHTLLAPEYAAGAQLFALFAPAMMCATLIPILIKSQELGEKVRELPWLMLGAGGANIALNLLLIPRLEAWGAALSMLLVNLLLAPLGYWLGQRHLRWPLPGRLLALSAAGLLLLAALHQLLPVPQGLVQLALAFTGYMLGYLGFCGAAIAALPRLFAAESQFMRSLAQSRAPRPDQQRRELL